MEFTCIVCPNGCRISAQDSEHIQGAACPRGVAYAKAELVAPKRSLTTTVKTIFADIPVVPVRTDGVIDKGLIFKAMDELNGIVLNRRYNRGDVIIENILGEKVNIIVTSDMKRRD